MAGAEEALAAWIDGSRNVKMADPARFQHPEAKPGEIWLGNHTAEQESPERVIS
jgi:hypothetical protein